MSDLHKVYHPNAGQRYECAACGGCIHFGDRYAYHTFKVDCGPEGVFFADLHLCLRCDDASSRDGVFA